MLRPNSRWDDRDHNQRKRQRYQPVSLPQTSSARVARLPIFAFKRNITYLVQTFPVLIIVGETGSGKTTQIPQYLLEAGWTANGQRIAVCQPRRIAAMTVAARVADELGEELGKGHVGYSVRFDHQAGDRCSILFTTDGTLLRETMQDPLLSRYSVIVVDEAHERSVHTDVLLGLLRKIQQKRPKLRIIVASATLDAEKFKRFFNPNKSSDRSRDKATILTVQGRQHPVELAYLPKPVSNFIEASVRIALEIHNQDPPGDILVFLPGQDEVREVVDRLKGANQISSRDRSKLVPLPLFAGMDHREQLNAMKRFPHGQRKVIAATNVAEASITIPGVVFVIDSMFVKLPWYNPHNGLDTLFTHPISQAQAKQRAGRAGRERAGYCIRLCTEPDFAKLNRSTVPEIQRTNLTWTVLQLKALGIRNVLRFRFISPPPSESLARSFDLLYSLGAIEDNGELTNDVGEAIVEFPVEPRISKLLLSSLEHGCSIEALTLAAMMSTQNILTQSNTKGSQAKVHATMQLYGTQQGDHLFWVNLYNAWNGAHAPREWCNRHGVIHNNMRKAAKVRAHLQGYLTKYMQAKNSKDGGIKQSLLSCCEDYDALLKSVVAGFFGNAARLRMDGKYETIRENRIVELHPTCIFASFGIPPKWIVFQDIQYTTVEYVRTVSEINPVWLTTLAPSFYSSTSSVNNNKDEVMESSPSTKRQGPVWEVTRENSAVG